MRRQDAEVEHGEHRFRVIVASLEALQREKLVADRQAYGYREASDWYFELQRDAAARTSAKTYAITEIFHPVAYRDDEDGYNQEWVTTATMRSQLEGYESK